MKKASKDIDAYITGAPKEFQDKLKELRTIIRKTAPSAEERMSYGCLIMITRDD